MVFLCGNNALYDLLQGSEYVYEFTTHVGVKSEIFISEDTFKQINNIQTYINQRANLRYCSNAVILFSNVYCVMIVVLIHN